MLKVGDNLTPEQVAEIRDKYHYYIDLKTARALCDTVDDLREKVTLLEGEVEAVSTKEGVENAIDQAVEVATVDLREQLREAEGLAQSHGALVELYEKQLRQKATALDEWIAAYHHNTAENRRLTDALREARELATPGLLRVLQQVARNTEYGWEEDAIDKAIAALRALAEGESDG